MCKLATKSNLHYLRFYCMNIYLPWNGWERVIRTPAAATKRLFWLEFNWHWMWVRRTIQNCVVSRSSSQGVAKVRSVGRLTDQSPSPSNPPRTTILITITLILFGCQTRSRLDWRPPQSHRTTVYNNNMLTNQSYVSKVAVALTTTDDRPPDE